LRAFNPASIGPVEMKTTPKRALKLPKPLDLVPVHTVEMKTTPKRALKPYCLRILFALLLLVEMKTTPKRALKPSCGRTPRT